MSVVYEATRVKLGRTVAIKFLRPSLCKNTEFVKRFETEAQAMSQLSHPNCVSVVDFGVTDSPYLVMEFVEGQTLSKIMKRGPMEPNRALNIIRQVLAALAHTHKHGIIHRDIKPTNIMITNAECSGDYVRILDFGLAKYFRETGDTLTGKNQVAGTFEYLAPENFRKDGQERLLDERTDLFSVGVVAYKLLTGSKPFVATSPADMFVMHSRPPQPISEAYPSGNFPPALEQMISKAISINPEDRFQTAKEFVSAIDKLLPSQMARTSFVLPHLNEDRDKETGSIVPLITQVVSERALHLKWWNTMLVMAVIALEFWGWIRIKQHHIDPTSIYEANSPSPWSAVDDSKVIISHNASMLADSPLTITSTAKNASKTVKNGSEPANGSDDGPPINPLSSAITSHESLPSPVVIGTTEQEPPKNETSSASQKAMRKRHLRKNLAKINRLVRRGKTTLAIAKLMKLSDKYPSNGYIHLRLGHLYNKKKQFKQALIEYERAIELNSRLRKNKVLIKNTVQALALNGLNQDATTLIQQQIGPPARNQLKKASYNAYGKIARKRAIKILNRMDREADQEVL